MNYIGEITMNHHALKRAKMKKIKINKILLTLLIVASGVYSKANTCANAYQFNLVSCGQAYSVITSTFGEPTAAQNPCVLSSGTEGVNWHTFTGTGSPVEASTLSQFTLFDTRIWIYEGVCGSLTCVASNDNYGGGTASQITFPTTAGLTYYIVVGGSNNSEGEYQLNVHSGQDTYGTTVAITACDEYTAPSGSVYSSSGTYYDAIPNSVGCDSITTISLTIVSLDLSVSYTGTAFLSNASGVTYQWIDCTTGLPLPGETWASLVAPSNGSYAVIVDNGVCSDTSDCISAPVGVDEVGSINELVIAPNPSSGVFTINTELTGGSLVIYDPLGRIIVQKEMIGNSLMIDISEQAKGVYFLTLENKQEVQTVRIVKE